MTAGIPIHVDRFLHDGRGPELQRAHWSKDETSLLAVDYFNPNDSYDAAHLKHVRFVKPQVVMVTPEEVIGGDALGDLLVDYSPAAMFDRGRSAWLRSFSQQHLGKCRHYQLLFYDELFDVIAEDVEVMAGGFVGVSRMTTSCSGRGTARTEPRRRTRCWADL